MKKLFPVFLTVVCVLMGAGAVAAQDGTPKIVNGGVVNSKAITLPKPAYPADAKKDGAEGIVNVSIEIDENGTVTSAVASENYGTMHSDPDNPPQAIPAHPALREAAEKAAMEAKFAPTRLNGQPVRVKGVITYSFSASRVSDGGGLRTINGGVLNGKAVNLPLPAYPPAAKAVGAGGTVSVQVMIDEEGNVISAEAVSGHPLLRGAAVDAARMARFSPTLLSGQPVKISGVIVYNFAP